MTEDQIIEEQEQELYENHRFTVDRGQETMRMDKYLQMRIEGVSRTKIQAAAKADCILVNGKPTKSSYKIKPLDVISVLLPTPPREIEIIPQQIDFKIVYEDDDLLVVDKQAGLVVHPGFGNFDGTLLNALAWYYQDKRGKDGNPITPYLVHRIDKDTSGLLLIAKTEEAQAHLAKQFFDHTIERKYNALVWGDFQEDDGTIVGNLARSAKDRRIMAVYDDPEIGKHAVTHWHVLERFGYVTLVECVLETGRTHQIRAHMKHIGHPLFNDAAYGGDQILKGTTFSKYKQFVDNCFTLLPRQALHALVLGFEHPSTHKQMHFESPFPDDMHAVIGKWRNYAQHKLSE
ncbi:MAG: RluA family pseudouridine synthase [Bacteroidales bacterium]|nr:RluA family pseudouridine synthase [Bacteroidales bacterium]